MEKVSEDWYGTCIGSVRTAINQKKDLEKRVTTLRKSLLDKQSLFVRMINASKILSTVSDDNTSRTLNFISGMVNKVLLEMFPKEPYTISLDNKLYQGTRPHIVMTLKDSMGNVLDTSTQTGDGIKQVICFMYVVCLIEIRKGRRLLILDERFNGLHKTAKKTVKSVMEILARGGFQFIFVEYGLNDFGKIYNVERQGCISYLRSVKDGEYSDDLVYLSDVDSSLEGIENE